MYLLDLPTTFYFQPLYDYVTSIYVGMGARVGMSLNWVAYAHV